MGYNASVVVAVLVHDYVTNREWKDTVFNLHLAYFNLFSIITNDINVWDCF